MTHEQSSLEEGTMQRMTKTYLFLGRREEVRQATQAEKHCG